MTEKQVGFLYKAAALLQGNNQNENLNFLRSYYLMRCKEMTKGYGLPEKHFSSKVRCSRCCIEWKKDTQMKIKAIKLSKKQKYRINSLKTNKDNKDYVKSRKELLNSNKIEQVCTFCKQSTVIFAPKPENIKNILPRQKQTKILIEKQDQKKIVRENPKKIEPVITKETKNNKLPNKKKKEVNVYSVTKEVFSLNNQKNMLASAQKEDKKIIKNNKKKKNKFAGLCEKAVLASAKLKKAKEEQNKLNLFLKPSS